MLFSACCWYRDPHGLPWIEYLHTGAKKIWYGIPDKQSSAFRKALVTMFPRYCKNKTIWLPSDTAMVPPDMLVSNDVPLCRTVQEPGQFIVVFPKAFTSSICTGYVVSESVYFAQQSWLENAEQTFQVRLISTARFIISYSRRSSVVGRRSSVVGRRW
jgi:protein Jumonji